MYLLYLDDAGSPANTTEDYFVLGGICVYEAQVEWISREIDKLATPYNAANPEDIEFHASAIFSRREPPWDAMSADDARGMLKAVLRVVRSSYDTARLFACAIEKKTYASHDPVEMAFEDLCQRFDMFLAKQSSAGESRPRDGHSRQDDAGDLAPEAQPRIPQGRHALGLPEKYRRYAILRRFQGFAPNPDR